MGIDIGRLNQRISFQRLTRTVSTSGDVTHTWTIVANCWAHVMSRGGQQVQEADKLIARHQWTIRTRYRDDILTTDRILASGKFLNISSISHDSSRADLTEFLCTEVVGEGA